MNSSIRIGLHSLLVLFILCPSVSADSLFSKQVASRGSLISDREIPFQVGDIITVLVSESVDARTTAGTETTKESTLEGTATPASNSFLTKGPFGFLPKKALPNFNVDVSNEHDGSGTTKRSNQLETTASCMVTKVMPNGNLRIEGSKRVIVNRENTLLVLNGTVRARDVSSENTVTSNQMADAEVQLNGKGPLWNTQRRGVITRVLDWISPF